MTIPWQAPDSSENGVLQEERGNPPHTPGWDQGWGVPEDEGGSGFHRVEWLEGQGLQEFLQQWTAALLGIDGTLVRPRWQAEPVPNLPPFDTPCWAATGISAQRQIGTYAWVAHGDGFDEMQRWEELEVLVSLYGPDADEYAGRLHSNLMVWQNTNLLRRVRMAFVDAGEFRWVPELVKEQWLMRVDKTITLRRVIVRDYPVLNLERFQGWIHADGRYTAPFDWPKERPPPPEGITDAEWDNILYVRRRRAWEAGLPLAGGQMGGPLRLQRDATEPREAVTRRQINRREGGTY